jgi:hypothetical protein
MFSDKNSVIFLISPVLHVLLFFLLDFIAVVRFGIACRGVTRERLGRHVPAETDTHAIEVLLGTMFSTRCVQRGYTEDNWGNRVSSVEDSVRKGRSWKGTVVQGEHMHGS